MCPKVRSPNSLKLLFVVCPSIQPSNLVSPRYSSEALARDAEGAVDSQPEVVPRSQVSETSFATSVSGAVACEELGDFAWVGGSRH